MTFDPRIVLVVGVGAAFGGILRLLVMRFVVARFSVAYGQCAMFINIGASYLIGIVIETSQTRACLEPPWRFFLHLTPEFPAATRCSQHSHTER